MPTSPSEPHMLSQALLYAGAGISVFPVNAKVPLTEHGFKDATTDRGRSRRGGRRTRKRGSGHPTSTRSTWISTNRNARRRGRRSSL